MAVSHFQFLHDSEGRTTRINAGTTTKVWVNDCVWAYGPVVHIIDGDIQSATSPPSISETARPITSATITTVATPTPTGDDNDKNTPESLGTGTVAVIGVVLGFAFMLLVFVMFYMFKYRRKRLKQHEAAKPPAQQEPKTHGATEDGTVHKLLVARK
ncbi:hypothetical protein F4808DRAFT_459807 [Astrocystis sublimbata]|nr:hypothetical protein F4808DRAFT_459807 [Astrocystis sublimbata]